MNKWLKKKLEQLSAKLNADDEPVAHAETGEESKAALSSAIPAAKLQNIEELKEITIGAITHAVSMLGYSNTAVSGLIFHSRFADNAVESLSIQSLINDHEFINQIKRAFKSKGIPYTNDFSTALRYGLEDMGKVTKIMDGIGVELLTPTEIAAKTRARVVATEGITWEPEYILEPTGKTYFIGRCKDPKIENGPKIHNDIAFIGIEEKNEELYKINNYISRSHAIITFDKDLGAYKLYRSRFLNNPAHKIKIYNPGLNDFTGVSLNQSAVPHVLKNGDAICFNDKVVLEFYIL